MKLEPIQRPTSVYLKLVYFAARKMFGLVPQALYVIYARSIPLFKLSLKMLQTEKKLSVDKNTRLLVRNYISHANACPFCSDAIEFLSQKEKSFEFKKVAGLLNFRDSTLYSPKEKALLHYLEEVNFTRACSDDTFAALQQFYSDREIVEITWLCASENYFNYMAKPLGLTSDGLSRKDRKEADRVEIS